MSDLFDTTLFVDFCGIHGYCCRRNAGDHFWYGVEVRIPARAFPRHAEG